jgi:hypothetical protein
MSNPKHADVLFHALWDCADVAIDANMNLREIGRIFEEVMEALRDNELEAYRSSGEFTEEELAHGRATGVWPDSEKEEPAIEE